MKYNSPEYKDILLRAIKVVEVNNTALPIGLAYALLSAEDKVQELEASFKSIQNLILEKDMLIYELSTGMDVNLPEYKLMTQIVDLACNEQTKSVALVNVIDEYRKAKTKRLAKAPIVKPSLEDEGKRA